MLDEKYTIGQITQLTGISKETLRIWERRYNFPNPQRDAQGDRLYSREELDKLSIVKKLLDTGKRPNALLSLSLEALKDLYGNNDKMIPTILTARHREFIEILKNENPEKIIQFIDHLILTLGLKNFIFEFLEAANTIVGECWERGEISIFQEHLYSEMIKEVLNRSISKLQEPEARLPKVLLTSFEGEHHSLGLMMVLLILRLESFPCIYLGPNLPIQDIDNALKKYNPKVCVLSLSICFDRKIAKNYLSELEKQNPHVNFWVGGKCASSLGIKSTQTVIHEHLHEVYATMKQYQKGP